MQLDAEQRNAAKSPEPEWFVFDYTTANQLGEFDTEEEALAFIEEIRPHGRFGPDGHDLRAVRLAP